METRQNRWLIRVAVPSCALLVFLVSINQSSAEVRTISAIGEYRMGDNDTRTDAKRLALLDAKRLALEQAGTYIESITEVKNFDVSKEEIRAYAAGIVEVVEQATKDIMERGSHVVRVDVTAKIDTDVVIHQMDTLRRNENAKAELLSLRAENDRLNQEVEAKTRELVALGSKNEVGVVLSQRQQVLNRLEISNLVARAWSSLHGASLRRGESTPEGRKAARNLVTQALAIEPSHPRVHLLLGVLLSEEKKYDEAIQEFGTVLQNAPRYGLAVKDLALTHLLLAQSLENTGDSAGAIEEYRTSIRLYDNGGAHNQLGYLFWKTGDAASAITEFRTALRSDPKSFSDHVGLGSALTEAGDPAGAIRAYRSALELNPDREWAYLLHKGLGNAYAESGDLKASIVEYRRALRLQPGEYAIRVILATKLSFIGDLDGAFEEFRIAATVKPESADPHRLLGSILEQKGDLDGAITEHRVAVRLEPDNAEAHYDLGQSLQKKGDIAGAIGEYRTALRLKPDAETHVNLGDAFRTNGNLDKAIAEYRAAILLGPNIAGAHYGQGFALKQKGLKHEARYEFLEYVRIARSLLKEYAEVYEGLDGTSYVAQGLRKGSEILRKRVDKVQAILRELEE